MHVVNSSRYGDSVVYIVQYVFTCYDGYRHKLYITAPKDLINFTEDSHLMHLSPKDNKLIVLKKRL